MSASHHPTEDVLFSYAAGSLSEPMALVVATHLALCPDCRHVIAEAETIGGALLEGLSAPAHSQAYDQAALMSEVDAAILRASRAPIAMPQRVAPTGPLSARRLFPEPLAGFVGGDLDRVAWKALAPGIKHAIISRDAEGATARLLRIDPGKAVFEHSHSGTELTLVLQGSYVAAGQRFARGDLEQADDEVLHRPIAGDEDVCICLAVTDAPLRFRNTIGRILQPLFGI